MRLSLQNRLLIPTLVLFALGTAISTWITYIKSRDAVEQAMIGQTEHVAEALVRQLSMWIEEVERDVETLAKDGEIRALSAGSKEDGPSGHEVNTILKDIKQEHDFFEFLAVVNPRGDFMASSDASLIGKINIADRDYFRESMKGNRAISDVIQSRVSGHPIFVVSVPVKDGGNVIGSVIGSIDFSQFSTLFVDSIKIGNTGYAYVLSREGTVVAHKDRSLIMTLNIKDFDWGRQILSQKQGSLHYQFKDVDKRATFRPVDRTGWIICVTTDDHDILAPVVSIRNTNILTAGSILLLSAILIYLLARHITGVIKTVVHECTTLAQACSAGDLHLRGQPERIDHEFRDIVVGINTILEAVITPLNVAAEYVNRIGRGDIPEPITETYYGDFNVIKDNLNACIENINTMSGETERLIAAAGLGRLDTRADISKLQGDFKKLVQGINRMMDVLVGHLDNVPLPVLIINRDLDIQFMNKAGTDLLQVPSSKLLGTKCHHHFKTGDCNTENCACTQALRREQSVTRETQAHPRDMDLSIQYIGNPFRDENGSVIGVLEVIMDQTAIRKAQAIAMKQAAYQAAEVEKLVVNLEGMSRGSLDIETSTAPADEDTKTVAENFAKINHSLELCVHAIGRLISDMESLAEAALEGRLSVRADASLHGGDYRKIVEGINKTLDAVLNPINEATVCLKTMAQGNMTVGVTGAYSGDHAIIKEALNGTLGSVNEILQQIRRAAEEVHAGANQVSDSSQSLSQGATEQAASLEQITSALTEIAAQTRTNAENAGQANRLAMSTREAAEQGARQMDEMVEAMKEINDSSQNIAKIIKVIDAIAFQTNLLALNAAVEAARAGRHGKGFAVVAEEVRNLAGRSARAASETAELIEGSVKKVTHGSESATRSAEALNSIVLSATRTTDLVGEIAAASNEQAQGIAQINMGLSQIDDVTQQNTANAEQTAAASEELSSQAARLSQSLSHFRLREVKPASYLQAPQSMLEASLAQDSRFSPSPSAAKALPYFPPEASRQRLGMEAFREAALDQTLAPSDIISLDEEEFGKY